MTAAMTLEAARGAAIGAVALAVLGAVLAVRLVRAVTVKMLTVLVLAVLAAVVWSQREEVTDCAAEVRRTLASGGRDDTTCTFLGRDVAITAPLG